MIRTIATKFDFYLIYGSTSEKLAILKKLNTNFPNSKYQDGNFSQNSPAIVLSRKSIPKEYNDSEKFKNLIS